MRFSHHASLLGGMSTDRLSEGARNGPGASSIVRGGLVAETDAAGQSSPSSGRRGSPTLPPLLMTAGIVPTGKFDGAGVMAALEADRPAAGGSLNLSGTSPSSPG